MSRATFAALLLAGLLAACSTTKREPTTGGACYIGTEPVTVGEPVALTDGTPKPVAGWWVTDSRGGFYIVQRARLSACLP